MGDIFEDEDKVDEEKYIIEKKAQTTSSGIHSMASKIILPVISTITSSM